MADQEEDNPSTFWGFIGHSWLWMGPMLGVCLIATWKLLAGAFDKATPETKELFEAALGSAWGISAQLFFALVLGVGLYVLACLPAWRQVKRARLTVERRGKELEALYERDPKVILARQLCELRERITDATHISAGRMLISFLTDLNGAAGEKHITNWLLFLYSDADEPTASTAVYSLMRELAANDLVSYEDEPGLWVAEVGASGILPYVRAWLRDHA